MSEFISEIEKKCHIFYDFYFIHLSYSISEIFANRNFNVFKRSDFIYQFTAQSRKEKKTLKILHDFTDNVIKTRRRELNNESTKTVKGSTNDDDDIGSKRKLALLDILLQSTIDGKPLTDLDIREEVDTFVVGRLDISKIFYVTQ